MSAETGAKEGGLAVRRLPGWELPLPRTGGAPERAAR